MPAHVNLRLKEDADQQRRPSSGEADTSRCKRRDQEGCACLLSDTGFFEGCATSPLQGTCRFPVGAFETTYQSRPKDCRQRRTEED